MTVIIQNIITPEVATCINAAIGFLAGASLATLYITRDQNQEK